MQLSAYEELLIMTSMKASLASSLKKLVLKSLAKKTSATDNKKA